MQHLLDAMDADTTRDKKMMLMLEIRGCGARIQPLGPGTDFSHSFRHLAAIDLRRGRPIYPGLPRLPLVSAVLVHREPL